MAGYLRWLIAKGNVFFPSAAAVVKLVDQLRKEGFIVDQSGAYAVKTVENTFGTDVEKKKAATVEPVPAVLTPDWLEAADREEIRLVWPVSGEAPLPVRYPLNMEPEGALDHALEIHRAEEYVYPTAKAIGPLPTICKCGEDLSFVWDEEDVVPAFDAATGIFAECDECSRTFNPSTETATLRNPFDATKERVPGGAAYRFAIVFRATKSFVADPKLAFSPALVAVVEKEFGRTFYEVGAVY
jgi:hypothetical protein